MANNDSTTKTSEVSAKKTTTSSAAQATTKTAPASVPKTATASTPKTASTSAVKSTSTSTTKTTTSTAPKATTLSETKSTTQGVAKSGSKSSGKSSGGGLHLNKASFWLIVSFAVLQLVAMILSVVSFGDVAAIFVAIAEAAAICIVAILGYRYIRNKSAVWLAPYIVALLVILVCIILPLVL